MRHNAVNRSVVLLLALSVSAIFLAMIRQFLMVLFLAGIFSALVHPFYRRLARGLGGRRWLASAATLLLLVALVLIPAGLLVGMITTQALDVAQNVKPWVEAQAANPNAISQLLEPLPFSETILQHQKTILEKAGRAVGTLSAFFIEKLSNATMGTINFFFMAFILLYAMYFFLMDGDQLLNKILYYLPLENKEEQQLLERFTSVARATIKGTAVIGLIQGGLGGVAFAVLGIRGAVFWGAVMAVTSVIPGVGTALVWVPAVVILLAGGQILKAVGLALFCIIVVGGIDNILRPILVGKDTKMHELLILFATLGGIFMFGFVGFIIGPIVAALFVTMWDMYGVVFNDVLPPVLRKPAEPVPARRKVPRAMRRD